MSVLGTTFAQSVAGAPGAERAARPIGPPKEADKVRRGSGGLHSRDGDDDEVDIDSVQVSDEARMLKDAAEEETRQERRGHDATPEHGHEIEDGVDEPSPESAAPAPGVDAGEPPIAHIDIEA